MTKGRNAYAVVLALATGILIGLWTCGPETLYASSKDPIRKGDVVTVGVTLRLSDGGLVFTTEPQEALREGVKKAPGYREPDCLLPLEVIAGEDVPVPGVRDMLPGMRQGERRTVTLPPEKAFGPIDKSLIRQFACVRTEPRTFSMLPNEYLVRVGKFPVVGTEVSLNPYFKARVIRVSEDRADLENLASEGMEREDTFGKTVVRVKGDEIRIVLAPRIGADFEMDGKKGVIASTDGTTFTADLNNPLAGKTVICDVEAVSSLPRASLDTVQIPWVEDHAAGLAQARDEKKPVVLVLYASWCQWSKRLLEETLTDPRIKAVKDGFIWVKIDSDKHKELYDRYKQTGFPLIVILNPDGTAATGRINGFADASRLGGVLSCVLHGQPLKDDAKAGNDNNQNLQGQGCGAKQ